MKEKYLNAFSEILDEKWEHTINIFYEEKAEVIERLDDLFSSIEDKDLNEINRKINETYVSIRNYNSFLPIFHISENVNYFLINYSENHLLQIISF